MDHLLRADVWVESWRSSGAGGLFVVLALALTAVLAVWKDSSNLLLRRVSYAAFVACLTWYLFARLPTLWSSDDSTLGKVFRFGFLLLELCYWLGTAYIVRLLTRTIDRSGEADQNEGWWDQEASPRVVVLIPTYNEPENVVSRTIACASRQSYQNTVVCVLDDGERQWVREAAESKGAKYFSRVTKEGGKAGNLNSALKTLKGQGEAFDYVAVLDADFLATTDFVERTLALLHDERVALVQTPQSFFNPDPFQFQLGIGGAWPDEERFLFNTLNPALDANHSTVCCGTSFLARASALESVGGFPTDSVSEDNLLSMRLRERGWRLVYLDEVLSMGLATEGLGEYLVQRGRWCLGIMQILRCGYGPFSSRGMRTIDRFFMLETFANFAFYPLLRIAFVLLPAIYWWTGFFPAEVSASALALHLGPLLIVQAAFFSWVSRGMHLPLIAGGTQLLATPVLLKATVEGLLFPQGRPFRVTEKGSRRGNWVIHWNPLLWFVSSGVLLVVGWGAQLSSLEMDSLDAPMTVWSVLALITLAVAALPCVERPRVRTHERLAVKKPISWSWGGSLFQGQLNNISLSGMLIEADSRPPVDEKLAVELPGLQALQGKVVRHVRSGFCLEFELSTVEREELICEIFSRDYFHPVRRTGLFPIAQALVQRLKTSAANHSLATQVQE